MWTNVKKSERKRDRLPMSEEGLLVLPLFNNVGHIWNNLCVN